jgi:leucyl-tRNA synthetase
VLFDAGVVSTAEPFQRLVSQGMILGEVEYTVHVDPASGKYVEESFPGAVTHRLPVTEVETRGNGHVLKADPTVKVSARAHKMSKSRGNVINPDDVVGQYGADSLRLYEMFMGPLEATKPWSMQGVNGVRNFLDRAWRLIVDSKSEQMQLSDSVQEVEPTAEQDRVIHSTIAAVTQDIENLSFNTAIARMMEFVNHFTKETVRPRSAMETLTLLLGPFAPHLAEELWHALGHKESLAYAPWPKAIEEKLRVASVEIPVQVNGKVRAKVSMPVGIDDQATERLARENDRVSELLVAKELVKVVIVLGKMINFVVKP